ncbi:MAG: hypothetical protein ABTQ73_03915 [Caldilineales bacterium]
MPPVVRASELGEYVYCARAWWLHRIQGLESHNTTALHNGQQAHTRHGHAVAAAQRQRRGAMLLLLVAVVLLAAAAILLLRAGL